MTERLIRRKRPARLTKTVECVLAAAANLRNLAELHPACRLRARLVYDPRDPFAVAIEVAQKKPVTWCLSRELLQEGASGVRVDPLGVGDVRVRRETTPTSTRSAWLRDEVLLELSSPDGRACLWVPTAPLQQFLDATYYAVPAGTESSRIEWDAGLRALIGDPA